MYTWDPEEYEKSSSQQFKWARELLAGLDLAGTERMLDIGCGDGKVTAVIASRLPAGSVLGIDTSSDMIRHARSRCPPELHPNLSFEVADARDLHCNAQFDVVFSNAALHWVVDHRPLLAGISRALRPAGKVLLQMGGKGNAAETVAAVERVMATDPWRGYFDRFQFPYGFHDPPDYRQWLLDAGLEPVRVELIEKDMVHQGEAGFGGWVRTTWLPYTQRVPESLREAFIGQVVSEYVRAFPVDSQGLVHVRMVRLEVEARKR